jgi:DNA-directed RNA polymerase specialized sigma24 family protein
MMMVVVAAASDPERSAPSPEAVGYLQRDIGRLVRLASSFLTDPRDVEDAVQDTLEAAWRSWDSVRDEGSRRAWLNTICVRRCLRVRRLRLRHGTVPLLDNVTSGDGPRDVDWDHAFARLSVPQRLVIVLHYHHGFTLDECADLMGRHPGTVRQHLARGLAHLRKEVDHE